MTDNPRRSRKRSALIVTGGFTLLVVLLLAIPAVRQGLRLTWLYFANVRSSAEWLDNREVVSVPFHYDGHVLVPVKVNRGPSLPFALDTGAPFPGIIGGPHLDGLSLDLGGTVPIGGSGSGATPRGRVIRRLDLTLGPAQLSGLAAVLIPWHEMSGFFSTPEQVYIQGILGYDLFRRYVVVVDFERELLTLHRPGDFRYDGDGEILELSFSQRKPYVSAEVTLHDGASVPVKLHVDLGQTSTLSLIPGSRPAIVTPPAAVRVEGRGLSGRIHKLMGRVRELRFGRHRLRDVICTFPVSGHATAGGRHGVVGLGALSRFRVILDYPRRRMILERSSATDRPFESDMSGVTWIPEGGTYRIKRVRPDSPASAEGLLEGDELVSMDGIEAEHLRLRELGERLRAGEGERVRLELRRGSKLVAVELTLRRRV